MILKKVGMITIGQSPRIDIIPEMREVLGTEVEIIEAGALDGLTLEEVKKFYPKGRDYILCTRMSDGTEVVVAKRFIVPRVQKCIDLLSQRGAEIIVFICTGLFPPFSSKKLFVEAQKILDHSILALHGIYSGDEEEGDGDHGKAYNPCPIFGGEDSKRVNKLLGRGVTEPKISK